MNAHDLLSEDGHAVLLLCSTLGITDSSAACQAGPFTLAEWNQLAKKIQASPVQRPAGLIGLGAGDLATHLGVSGEEADRIALLLGRGGRVALELESLCSRGMWAITRVDEQYPTKLRETLKHQAPTVLFGAGEIRLLGQGGIAVVGSRDIDGVGTGFAQIIGGKAARSKCPIISGGARGTDRIAMQAALDAGGTAFGVLADSLERTVRQSDVRQYLLEEAMVLLTPYAPTAGFSVGAAMGRNKIVYGLADYAIIVSSDYQKGGTWAGATEALKAKWCPVFVRQGTSAPVGNQQLLKLGAIPVDDLAMESADDLRVELTRRALVRPAELDLFGASAEATERSSGTQPN